MRQKLFTTLNATGGMLIPLQPERGGSNNLRREGGSPPATFPREFMRAAPKTNPLQAAVVIGGSSYPETAYSLLEVASRDVIVWAVKPAEEGIDRGVVLRIWNQAHRPMATEVRFSSPPVTAMQTTHIETDLREARLNGSALPVILQTQQLQTFRLQFERPAQR